MFPAKKWRVCTLNNGQKEKPAAVHQSKVSFLGSNYTPVQHTIVSGKNVEFGHKFNLESCFFFRSLESGNKVAAVYVLLKYYFMFRIFPIYRVNSRLGRPIYLTGLQLKTVFFNDPFIMQQKSCL